MKTSTAGAVFQLRGGAHAVNRRNWWVVGGGPTTHIAHFVAKKPHRKSTTSASGSIFLLNLKDGRSH